MPDLNNPEEEGKLMEPVFFVTGQKLDTGKTDQERRETVADWITSRKDRWFAKAYVNRMWSELVGRGFYEPVDDIGPDRTCSAPQTLDYLADRFAGNQYDVKWLMRVITATEAYARAKPLARTTTARRRSRPACPQRLRGDQLYNALVDVLGIEDARGPTSRGRRLSPSGRPGPRGQVNQTFGYDPSVRRDEIAGSIPQALFLMNGAGAEPGHERPQPEHGAGQAAGRDRRTTRPLVAELYLRCLAREPNDERDGDLPDYVQAVGNRAEASRTSSGRWSIRPSFLNRK